MRRPGRWLALALAVVMGLSTSVLAAGVNDLFPAVNSYPGFADVAPGSWYESAVKTCYETGLMNGTDHGFAPEETLPVSQVLVIAARLRAALTGEAVPMPAKGESAWPWYAPYLSYWEDILRRKGVQPDPQNAGNYFLPETSATRQDFIDLLGLAIEGREADFPAINTITALPDSDDELVLRFYNMGILTGTDDYGTFNAAGTLTRAECAAMVARLVRGELRKRFVPKATVSSGGTWAQGPYAGFIRGYLGQQADAVYFSYGGLSVRAGDWLTAALYAADGLNAKCLAQGLDFDWSLYYGDVDLATYVYRQANTDVLEATWELTGPVLDMTWYDLWAANHWKAKHILVTDETTAAMLYDFLRGDPAQFDPLLVIYGEDPGMEQQPGGYVFGTGQMVPEFENGVKALQAGQISEPIQSQHGWHIIQRLELTQADYTAQDALEMAWDAFLSQGYAMSFSSRFPMGIDIQGAYAAWQSYQNS